MKEICVDSKSKSYSIYIERNIIKSIGEYIKQKYDGRKVAVITDHNIQQLYGKAFLESLEDKGVKTTMIAVKPGEESKNFNVLLEIYKELSDFKLDRNDLIITFGGGVVGDLGGFAASTYLRGVPFIQVPSSLLAQVDSSIGGKVAVDLPQGKNLAGSFYNPDAVFIDPELLKTLDKRFLHDGLAEVIKYGCIKDKKIIERLQCYRDDAELLDDAEHIIYTCCNIKKRIVEIDEKDFGERMLLNFGHTIGHAVEKYFDFKKYTHGEAVGLGMVRITEKSEKLGLTEKGTSKLIAGLLKKYSLPIEMPLAEKEKLIDIMALDKKNNGGSISLVIIREIGDGFIQKVKSNDMELYI